MIHQTQRSAPKSATLSVKEITKSFDGVIANDSISLEIVPGEIHALLGENGAGKSTLLSILFGLLRPDSGQIFLDGSEISFSHPSQALRHGIALVQQHVSLIEDLSVLENIILGCEPLGRFGISFREAEERIQKIKEAHQFTFPLHSKACALPVGVQQQVEIAKALFQNPSVILFDEPTAALITHEIDHFLNTLLALKNQGLGIVFISHRLPEVEKVADKATVLRQGKVTLQSRWGADSRNAAALAMIGDALPEERYALPPPGEEAVAILNLCLAHSSPPLENITLSIRKREIVGIAGVAGNGQEALIDCLMGVEKNHSGSIHLHGEEIARWSVDRRRRNGLALIPQDRNRLGLIPERSLMQNAMLNPAGLEHADAFWIRSKPIASQVEANMREFEVKAESPSCAAHSLSGGHQQRFVLSRELASNPQWLIAHDPTRGLDIRASRFVHEKCIEACRGGASILLIASEWPELFLLCHRIAVIYRGKITDMRDTQDWTLDALSQALLGGRA